MLAPTLLGFYCAPAPTTIRQGRRPVAQHFNQQLAHTVHRSLIFTARVIIIIIVATTAIVVLAAADSSAGSREAASVERGHVVQVPMMVVVVVIGQVAELERPLLEEATRLELLVRLHSRSRMLSLARRLLLTLATSTTAAVAAAAATL